MTVEPDILILPSKLPTTLMIWSSKVTSFISPSNNFARLTQTMFFIMTTKIVHGPSQITDVANDNGTYKNDDFHKVFNTFLSVF